LLKWQKGNDLWPLVLLSPLATSDIFAEQYLAQGIPTSMQEVILEFDGLFQTPIELPPSRTFDYAIPMFLDTIPINCRPYRYSANQKDEVEKKVSKMLQSGLVVPSTSHFASPVLPVKKKDGTW
jgi:hypothetical protein